MKTVIFGIDGADFTAIQAFSDDLPHLCRLAAHAACAPLISTIPPHTSLGWVSLMTGATPGRHGIFQFWKTKTTDYEPQFNQSGDVGVPFVWDWLSDRGERVNIVNVPMTHPPHPVNGCLITWPLTNTLRFSYPNDLLAQISREVGPYVSDLGTMYRGEPDYIEKAKKYIHRRTEAMLHLMNKFQADFSVIVYTEVDRISHFAYGDMGEDLRQAYIAIDEALGRIWATLPSDAVLAVVSDHGFTASHWDFHIHEWLAGEEWLRFAKGESHKAWYLNELDWSNTLCYMPAPGSYGLNLNLRGREAQGCLAEADAKAFLKVLRDRLLQIQTPDGQAMFREVRSGVEIYAGERAQEAPDLVLIPYDYGNMVQALPCAATKDGFIKASQAGYHRREGVFLLTAPGIISGMHESLDIEDAMVNILYASGLPVPAQMSGRVHQRLFDTSWQSAHPLRVEDHVREGHERSLQPESGYSSKEKEMIEKRLREMGYI